MTITPLELKSMALEESGGDAAKALDLMCREAAAAHRAIDAMKRTGFHRRIDQRVLEPKIDVPRSPVTLASEELK